MIAAVHLDPRVTIPIALLLACMLAWYWRTLERPDVPRARRRLRRLSVSVMLVAIPNFVAGLSIFDPSLDPTPYLVSWSLSIVLILLILLTACGDVLVTLHEHGRRSAEELGAERARLVRTVSEEVGAGAGGDDPS